MEQQNSPQAPTTRGKLSRWKFAVRAFLSVCAIVLASGLVFLFYPDPVINAFLKGRITEAFREAYPAYAVRIGTIHYGVWENRVACDSIVVEATDSTMRYSAAGFSISGVGWLQLLVGNGHAPNSLASSVMEAKDIVLNFPLSKYELRCGRLRVSVPDSEMIAHALELHPTVDDQQFFAESKFRKTRFNLTTRQCRLTGVAYLEALDRKKYRARGIHIHDVCLDVLINKDKPATRDSSTPPMPNEILSSMKETIQCDSMDIINGALKYGERFDLGSTPGVITFDSMQVGVERIATRGGANDTVAIRGQGEFMKSGKTKVFMSIPVSSSEFSFRYSGSLHSMDLRALNPWIEIAEQQRVKSGTLQTATFDIEVIAGRAGGSVRAAYRDLILAAINKHTGSERGYVDRLASFVANTFKIRGTNMPDKSGSLRIGKVKYIRQRDDPFFRFWWFALRSGVGDAVGF
jgi:hypothetical protein